MKTVRTLIAPVVIAALAITGITTAQAKADSSDVAKVIVGAIAITALANALDNSGGGGKAVTVKRYDGRVVNDNRYRDERRWRQDRRLRASAAQCLSNYRARHHRTRQLYDHRCLMRTTRALGTPPKQCAVRVVVRGGRNRVAYDPRCLERKGYWTRNAGRYDRYHDRRDGVVWDSRRNGHIYYGH